MSRRPNETIWEWADRTTRKLKAEREFTETMMRLGQADAERCRRNGRPFLYAAILLVAVVLALVIGAALHA